MIGSLASGVRSVRASGAPTGQRRGSPHRPSAHNQLFRVIAAMPLMRLGHVFLHGGNPTPCAAACMDSNTRS